MLHKDSGTLHYTQSGDTYKLIVLIDPGIGLFYRKLIPPYYNVIGQRYAPHISVVRKETPENLDAWGKYEGHRVNFEYDTDIQHDVNYWWLNVFSTQLEAIRTELGLPVTSPFTLPPAGFLKCFHTTIGNTKAL